MTDDASQSDDFGELDDDELYCHKDRVAVTPDRIRCRHPSSQCPFRETCAIARRARKKK